jgi:membrane fusion protein, multidrug efflux system
MRLARSLWVVALATAALAACGQDEPVELGAAPPAAVRAAPVTSAAAAQQTRAVGVLAPRNELKLAFKTGGMVDAVHVDAGDIVKRGQPLAALKRDEVDAAVAQAAEAVAKARRDFERAQRLRADEVATDEQVQDLETAYNVARANLGAVRFNASFARIDAPADGIVFERLVEAGELVQPGEAVLVLGATDSGWVVRTGLSDRDAVRVDVGSPAEVMFDAFPGRTFAGEITRVGASADRSTGTFEVEIEVQPEGARFARGLVAKISLELAERKTVASGATLVPVTALVEANGPQATVFVLDVAASVARRKEVTLGPIVGEQVIVTTGLSLGEQVITDGAAWLTDGRAVRVVAAEQG